MRSHHVLTMVLVLLSTQAMAADFIDPIEVTIDAGDHESPDMTIDSIDNVSIIYNRDDQVFLATTLIGLGEEEFEVTESGDEASGARIAAGELGLIHIAHALESTAAGAVGNDILLVDNEGGTFDDATELAATDEDESDPAIDVVLGNVHVVWNLVPDGSEPEVYYSYDCGDGTLVETGKSPRVAVASDETAHIIYQRDGDVHHRQYDVDLEELSDEVNVSDSVGTESTFEIAVDSDDTVHIVFLNGDALFHTDDGGGGFSDPVEIEPGPIEEIAIATGPDGEVVVVFVDADGTLQFVERVDGEFGLAEEVVETTTAEEPTADFDSEGYLHVAWVEDGSIFYTNAVPRPFVDFTADVTEGEAPLTVQFTNLTEGVVGEYLWDLGDGTTTSEDDPLHTYTEVGTHTVRLVATGPGGAAGRTRLSYIRVEEPTNILRMPDVGVYPGEEVRHPIYGTSTNPLQGFTLLLGYDDAFVSVDEVSFEDTVTGTLDPEFVVITDEPDGADSSIRIAVLVDLFKPFDGRTIDAGDDLLLGTIDYVVPSDLEVGDETTIEFVNEGTELNVFSASTDAGVISIVAARIHGGYEVVALDSEGRFLRGDVDGNEVLALTDAVETLLWMFEDGSEPECLDAADFDDDESVTLLDVTQFLLHVFQRGAAPDYPYPSPGLDPDGDDLDCGF